MLKQGLDLKLSQKLSPLQIQTIKLIELPIQELEQKIRREIEENPVLDDSKSDTDKDISISELKDNDSTPSYRLYVNNSSSDDKPQYNTFSVRDSFLQSLQRQLGFRNLTDKQYSIASFLIGSLDHSGYIRRDLDSVIDDLAFRLNVEAELSEIEEMLYVIQDLEPIGIGARDLRECLLLQLKAKTPSEDVDNAILILEDYFEEFSRKHFQKILAKMNLSESQMKAAIDKITHLNPTPGAQIDDSYSDQAQQIIPDFFLRYEDEEFFLTLPRFSIPEIKISKKYRDLLEDTNNKSNKEKKEAITFVKQKIDSAKNFIDAIKQRYNTLQSTMQAILDFQKEYFIDGNEENLRPMILKDIAEITGFDISTISRVVNSKYIETHFGIFQLKYFFSEGLENKAGEEVSTRELKKALAEIIEQEDKRKPFTDDRLVIQMSKKGYKLARRTVAKYRDQLNIPTARMRKEL